MTGRVHVNLLEGITYCLYKVTRLHLHRIPKKTIVARDPSVSDPEKSRPRNVRNKKWWIWWDVYVILLAFDWMNGGFVNCDFIGILLFSEIWDDFIAVVLAF